MNMGYKEDEIIAIINRFSSLIKHVIQNNLYKSDDIDPEDIEQEVKIKIWKVLRKGKKVEKLSSYISKVAYSVIVDELRRTMGRALVKEKNDFQVILSIISEIHDKREMSPQYALEKKESRSFISKAVDSLSTNRRYVLRLYIAGMTINEICEFTGWEKGNVRHLFYRGIDDLKKSIGVNSGPVKANIPATKKE